jgi:c-di-GMP-binding flagellar brake protein YcgR
MLFPRKSAVRQGNRRASYRKRQCKAYALSVLVSGPRGTVPGQFLDLSMGGVGAAFARDRDPQWKVGQVVDLVVQSLSHGKVQSPARVIYARPVEGRLVRYGFAFLDAGDLYAQLDTFYSRLFNRRSSMRVRPSLDRKVKLTLSWPGGLAESTISEISATGVGLLVDDASAKRLAEVERVGIEFRLPGMRDGFRGHARIVNRTAGAGRTLLGLAFDLDEAEGLSQHAAALEAFIDARAAEMERWENSWS